MAQECGVLTVERALFCQFIDAHEQLRAGDRWLTAGVFSPGFIDRLGYCRFVLAQLLEGPFEVGVGIGGSGQGASGGGLGPRCHLHRSNTAQKPTTDH